MTQEHAKSLLPIITAYAEGKTVEVRGRDKDDTGWEITYNPCWAGDRDYRIKPEPREWWILPGYASDVKPRDGSFIHVREVLP